MKTSRQVLQTILLEIIDQLSPSGGTGHGGRVPSFDYYALDYLEFAELNLQRFYKSEVQREKENELISCLSNLKRALDCQIECFLESWNIRTHFNKKNLGLDTKLSFLAEAGLFSSRTIHRFSKMRNRFEHEFQKPEVQDLEALYDLVTAFVAILQSVMMSGFMETHEMEVVDANEESIGSFVLEYDPDSRKFSAELKLKTPTPQEETVSADLSNPSDFAYFFRVLYLLNHLNSYSSLEHIKAKLHV